MAAVGNALLNDLFQHDIISFQKMMKTCLHHVQTGSFIDRLYGQRFDSKPQQFTLRRMTE